MWAAAPKLHRLWHAGERARERHDRRDVPDDGCPAGMKVEVRKDATGLWLKVDKPGVTIIIR